MKKRFLSILLTIAVILPMCLTASATTDNVPTEITTTSSCTTCLHLHFTGDVIIPETINTDTHTTTYYNTYTCDICDTYHFIKDEKEIDFVETQVGDIVINYIHVYDIEKYLKETYGENIKIGEKVTIDNIQTILESNSDADFPIIECGEDVDILYSKLTEIKSTEVLRKSN